MKAVILAAGEGKRLRPFTETMPKVMLPICNKPVLEHVFDAVKNTGIEEVIVVVGYKKEVILDYFKNYEDMKITYVTQDKQLGTAHALLQALNHVTKQFIVLSGDNIIDRNSIMKLIEDESEYSLLIKEHPHPSKYGMVFLEKNYLKDIVEKPKEESAKFISTGTYKLPKTIFTILKEHASEGIYDLTSVIQTLLKHDKKINTIHADSWMDVIYPWDLISVNASLLHTTPKSIAGTIEKGVTIKGPVSIGKNTVIYSGCYLVGPVIIGEDCEIGPNVCLFPSTAIGNNAVIHPFSEIRNSVIMNDVHIGSHSLLSHSIIGKGTVIGNTFSAYSAAATIETEEEFKKLGCIGTMIAEDCTIGAHTVVEPGIIIGRTCEIASMKRVQKHIPSGTKVM